MRVHIRRFKEAGPQCLSDEECHETLEAVAQQLYAGDVTVTVYVPSLTGAWSMNYLPKPAMPTGWRRRLSEYRSMFSHLTGWAVEGPVITIGVGEAHRAIAELSNMTLTCQDQQGGLAFTFASAVCKWHFANIWSGHGLDFEEAEMLAVGCTLDAGFTLEVKGSRHGTCSSQFKKIARCLKEERPGRSTPGCGHGIFPFPPSSRTDRRAAAGNRINNIGDIQ